MDIIPQDTPQKQCTKCDKPFPPTFEYFPRFYRRGKIAMRGHCLICERAIKNAKYRAKHPKKRLIKDGYKWCPKCEQELLLKEFSHGNQRKDELQGWCKVCSKEYRDAHREDERIYRRKHHKKHSSRIRKQRHTSYMAKREAKCEQSRQYRQDNPEKVRATLKRYSKTTRGILVARTAHQNRYLRKKKAMESELTAQQIQDKLKAQKYRCYYAACGHAKFEKKGGKYIFHLEHIIPLSRIELNPRHDVNNVVLACPSCNLHKSAKLPHEWPDGGRLF